MNFVIDPENLWRMAAGFLKEKAK
jgi:hypothetical protein